MEQFLRKVRLTARTSAGGFVVNPGGIQKHELKIEFAISKGVSSTENSGSIWVYNLNEAHRNALGKEGADVELEAGYCPHTGGSNVGLIFNGQIRDIEHKRKGATYISELKVGEGDKAFREATINKSYKAGTDVKTVIEDMYKELEKQGIKRGEWKFPEDLPKFVRPYAAVGAVKRELDTIGRGKGFYWSVQNGALEIIPADGSTTGIVHLTPETGLVGTPTITDNGIKCVAFLNPEVRPGRRIKVESKTLEMNAKSGEYRVTECTFSGDNRDGQFVVHIVGEALKSEGSSGGETKVDEGKVENLRMGFATPAQRE